MDATADKVSPLPEGEDAEDQATADPFAILKAARRLYDAAWNHEEHNIREGYDDLEVKAGNQWDESEKLEREEEGRPCETVNKTGQFIRQVTGDMRQMRPAIKVIPNDDATEEGAEAMADVVRYVENRSDAPSVYFQGADSQVSCGIGAWRIVTEYAGETTFNQEARIVPIDDALAVMWDEDSVLPTREDAMECLIPIDMAVSKFKKQYKDATPTDFASTDMVGLRARWGTTEDKVRVGEYWWKEPTTKTLALLQDGSVVDLTGKSDDELAEIQPTIALDRNGAPRIEERPSFKVRRALVTASEVIEGPEDWPGSYIPIVSVIGEEVKIQRKTVRHGVIRFAKPVQRMYNWAISADIEVTTLQPKAPYIGTEKNFQRYAKQWGNANRKNYPYLVYTPDDANGFQKPSREPPPVASQAIAASIERADRDMHATTGIYPASLGAKSNETSGKAVMARQREGDTGTFVYIDNWTRAIRYTGKILVDLIPHIYDTQRVLRIVGEDGKIETFEINKAVGYDPASGQQRIFRDVTAGSYDVSIQMGPSYATKREEARDGMTAFMQSNPQVAAILGDLYAKAQDWPMAEEISERLETLLPAPIRKAKAEKSGKPLAEEEAPQPDPMQVQAAQMEMAGKQAEVEQKQAQARKAVADAQTAEIALEKELMTPPAGAQPEIGAALEGMARSIVELRMMMGGLLQGMQPPPVQPPMAPAMPPEPPPADPEPMITEPPSEAAFSMGE